jgi:predicted RNA binding protein YcfA (HicA-like mRNA interferase family)
LSKIPLLSALEIIKILAIFGFRPVRQTGSHIHLLHPGSRRLVTVPSHPEIAAGTLLSILKQANIDKDEFLRTLLILEFRVAQFFGERRIPEAREMNFGVLSCYHPFCGDIHSGYHIPDCSIRAP